jgi:hypothetical protein
MAPARLAAAQLRMAMLQRRGAAHQHTRHSLIFGFNAWIEMPRLKCRD